MNNWITRRDVFCSLAALAVVVGVQLPLGVKQTVITIYNGDFSYEGTYVFLNEKWYPITGWVGAPPNPSTLIVTRPKTNGLT